MKDVGLGVRIDIGADSENGVGQLVGSFVGLYVLTVL